MNIFPILVIITLAEHCRASSKEGEEVKTSGIVKEMTPVGTVFYPKHFVGPAFWIEEKPSEMLKFSCYTYVLASSDHGRQVTYENRVSVQTKLEGIEIENYVVTGCPDSKDNPLMQYTHFKKTEKGYEYNTVFQYLDNNEDLKFKCCRRTYTTEHGDFTTTLTRGEPQPITCTDEEVSKMKYIPEDRKLQAGATRPKKIEEYFQEHRLLIIQWGVSGSFDTSISEKDVSPGEGSLKSWNVKGNCATVTLSLSCRVHRKFYTNEDTLVADIYAGRKKAPLDRIVVTSCEERGIYSSFMCVKERCPPNDVESCKFTMMYRNVDGECLVRYYDYELQRPSIHRDRTKLLLKRFAATPAQCHPDMDDGIVDMALRYIKGAASSVGGWFSSWTRGSNNCVGYQTY